MRSILALRRGPTDESHPSRNILGSAHVRAILESNAETAALLPHLLDGFILGVHAQLERDAACQWDRNQTGTLLTLVVDDPVNDALHVAQFTMGYLHARRRKDWTACIDCVGMLLRSGDEWHLRWTMEPGRFFEVEATFSENGRVAFADFSAVIEPGAMSAQHMANIVGRVADLMFSRPSRSLVRAVAAKIAAEEGGCASARPGAKPARSSSPKPIKENAAPPSAPHGAQLVRLSDYAKGRRT